HAIFMPVLIEFSRCIGTYSSAKFEFIIYFSIIVIRMRGVGLRPVVLRLIKVDSGGYFLELQGMR
ncbi:hypothetical protein AALA13_18330, partial [Lachnospiraceae bacterium 50-23]